MAYPLASISISDSCCRFGNASTSVVLVFYFKVLKDYFSFPPHLKTCFTFVKSCKGEAIHEKVAIKFLQYWASPRKILTSVTLVGLGQF